MSVAVEARAGPGDAFGRGVKTRMPLAAVLDRLVAGDASLYLSAQEPPLAPGGVPLPLNDLALRLAPFLPVRPALVGGLLPQALNVWAGACPAGSHSGLHHDYHDNLYVLLAGVKTFTLFPPACVAEMATVGTPVRVHASGRVEYAGDPPVCGDGSPADGDPRVWTRLAVAAEAGVDGSDAEDAALAAALGEADEGGGWREVDDYDDASEDDSAGVQSVGGPHAAPACDSTTARRRGHTARAARQHSPQKGVLYGATRSPGRSGGWNHQLRATCGGGGPAPVASPHLDSTL